MKPSKYLEISLFLVVAATVAGCCQRGGGGGRVKGTGYSYPMPSGWERVTTKLTADSAIKASRPPSPGVPEAVFLVESLGANTASIDPTDVGTCRQIAQGTAAAKGGVVTTAGLGDGPVGKTCTYDITVARQQTRFVLAKGARARWLLGCMHDVSDVGALAKCGEATRGFTFE